MEKSNESMIERLKPIIAEIQRLHFSREAEIRRSEQREGMMVQHMDSGLDSVAADVGQQGAQRLCIICFTFVFACIQCTQQFPQVLPQSSRYFVMLSRCAWNCRGFVVWRGERTGRYRSCTVLLHAQQWRIQSGRVVRSGCGTGPKRQHKTRSTNSIKKHRKTHVDKQKHNSNKRDNTQLTT